MYCLNESRGSGLKSPLLSPSKPELRTRTEWTGKKPSQQSGVADGSRASQQSAESSSRGLEESLRGLFRYPSYEVVIKAYPSNEINIRYQPRVGKYKDSTQDRENKRLALLVQNGQKEPAKRCLLETKEDLKKSQESTKRGWGELPVARVFNKRSQKFVIRSLSAIEAKFGKESMRFLTLTLPGSTDAAMGIMSRYSAYIVNRLNTFITRRLGEYAKYRVNVWEKQKRGALHLHAVVCSKNQESLEKVDRDFKGFCFRLFHDLSKMTGVDMFGRTDGTTWKDNIEVLRCHSEKIRKSVARYMSKYMSKKDSKTQDVSGVNKSEYYPATWASWGRGARQVLRERTIEIARKRIDEENAYYLAVLCQKLGIKYSPKKYSEPLIYKDKFGGGVNLKMIVKPENMDIAIWYLEEWMSYFSEERNDELNTRLPDWDTVQGALMEQWFAEAMESEIESKYGHRDGRSWQKVFRRNRCELPKNSSDLEWREFYSSRGDHTVDKLVD